ncbi:non-structural maintenance of chromosomes element 4 homolog A-like [Bradysia coprophila]|uniref:non-structural maintenance of chromosomes element 4 homolog A-like n=1 Tax=Bradysia coprophila TaxID=38358 RepID=UPI00187D991B|nr:non-structural maintenance of chromosomes element 4 homolog A-like [Bradysia coprophila]
MTSQEIRKKSSVRRNQYKELLELGSQIEATTENETPIETLRKIADVAKRSDALNAEARFQDRLENTTEVVMDAQVMKMTHELLGSIVQTMDNTEISDDEFVAAIHQTIGPNMDWDKLGEKLAVGMSKTIPYSQPLFGTFDEATVIPPKEVKERRKNTTIKNSQQMKPIAVVQQQKEEQDAVSVNMIGNQIIELYETNGNEPLPYYKLIINPENFMRTIQNAFQVSFLLRDGLIAIEVDEDGYPTVRPVNATDKKDSTEGQSYQMVSNLSTPLCDEMIRRYNITEPMITWPDSDE